MKKFVNIVLEMKFNACICFTAIMVIYALTEVLWNIPLISGWRVIQLLLWSLLCGGLQYLFFSGVTLKKMSHLARTLLFGLCILILVAVFAVAFHWFPVDQAVSWFIFLAIFAAVFLIATVAFEILYRITGRRYTSLLEERRSGK